MQKNTNSVIISTIILLSGTQHSVEAAPLLCGNSGISPTHWVNTCPASTIHVGLTMFFGIDTDLDAFANIDVSFTGTATITLGEPYISPDNTTSYADRINTEIISMNLTGNEAFVNGWEFVMGTQNGLGASLGYIQATADGSFATSRFDTIFEIRNTPYGDLKHNGSFFFENTTNEFISTSVPYNHTGSPFGTTFPLLTNNGSSPIYLTDQINTNFTTVGRPHFVIETASQISPVPVPGALSLFITGLFALSGQYIRARKRG